MKSVKVFLQYPWKFPDSPYYKYLISNPPKGISYLNTENQRGVITSGKKFSLVRKIKNTLRKILGVYKIPNYTLTPEGDYDLIHCAHCLSLNKVPWVVDVEHYWNFSSSGEVAYSKNGKEKIRRMLKSRYCKKILPWTEAAKKSIIDALHDREIEKKIKVIYPAIPYQTPKRKAKKNITLLFVGRYFYQKGGLHILKVFDELTKKYKNIECIIISEVPKEYLRRYGKNTRIKFYPLMPQKKLFGEIYQNTDIFVYPGYSDTFGFAMLEAMSFGIPVITVDGFAKREIVENNKTGFVIDFKGFNDRIAQHDSPLITREIVEKCSLLIENPKKLERMKKECRNIFKAGKFSVVRRNRDLKEIYREAANKSV